MCRLSTSDPGKGMDVLSNCWQSFCSKNAMSLLHYCTDLASSRNIIISNALDVIYQDVEYLSLDCNYEGRQKG